MTKKDAITPLQAALARAEAAEALAYERLESALFAEQRADDAEVERDELRDANSVLSDALEKTRQALGAVTARVAELEAELASDAADENQWLDAYIESAAKDGATIKRLMARVAELEAQLADAMARRGRP